MAAAYQPIACRISFIFNLSFGSSGGYSKMIKQFTPEPVVKNPCIESMQN